MVKLSMNAGDALKVAKDNFEVVIEGESVKIFATIPLPNKIHERERDKTDIPGPLRRSFSEASTFNAGATLGPVNETNMARIWNKHKQTNAPLKRKVFVGMSGGVDSSVAAALLKEAKPNNFDKLFGRPTPKGFRGYEVHGVFMKNWADPRYPCPWQKDRQDAMRVATILDIPFETWDFSKEYRDAVVSYMVREYALGRTPNPDVMCNREIKFGLFLQKALERGADFVATGHYVRMRRNLELRNSNFEIDSKFKIQNSKLSSLLQASDSNKDQSYFLWTLNQKQLAHALFPIGDYTKPEVRALAKKFGLPTAEKPDSQGICFIGEIDVREFLRDELGTRRGKVLTTAGKVVGEHEGVQFYTIGQRHGLGFGGGVPFYVTEKNASANTLTVAEGPNDAELFSKTLEAYDANWISGIPRFPLTCEARIRYRQPLQDCRVEVVGDRGQGLGNLVRVIFSEEQRAVTPGQSVVFYRKGVMLGGGIIA